MHLHRYPGEKVHVTCSTCQRGGRFDKAALIERVGANAPLPELRLRLAEGLGCETAAKTRAGEWLPGGSGAKLVSKDTMKASIVPSSFSPDQTLTRPRPFASQCALRTSRG